MTKSKVKMIKMARNEFEPVNMGKVGKKNRNIF